MAPDAMRPGAQKAKTGPGPAPASRATGSTWQGPCHFLNPKRGQCVVQLPAHGTDSGRVPLRPARDQVTS